MNQLLALDPVAISRLFEKCVTCNEQLAAHDTVQIMAVAGQDVVSVLGLLNGLCGKIEDKGGPYDGWGPVAAVYHGDLVREFRLLI